MSIITTPTLTNNLSLLNHPSKSSLQPIQISNVASNLYLGPGSINVPGMTNVYFAPSNLIDGIKALIAAIKIGDKEGVVENTLRVIEAPFCFSNAFMQCIYNALHAGVYLNVFSHPSLPFALSTTGPLFITIAIAGFLFCVIEGAIETFGLVRTIDFFKNSYPTEIEDLKQLKFSSCIKKISQLPPDVVAEINSFIESNDLSLSENVERMKKISEELQTNIYSTQLTKLEQTYFQVSPEEINEINDYVKNKLSHLSPEEQNARKSQIIKNSLDAKKSELTRKIHPWLTNEIEGSLPDVIRGLQSPLPSEQIKAKEKAESIFADIKIQSQKKMLVHSIGMVAVLVTIAGLIAGCVFCPVLVPFILLGIGGAIAIARGLVFWGYMNARGWNFSTKDCIEGLIPESIRDLFKEKTANNNDYELKSRNPYILKYTLPGSRIISHKREYKNTLSKLDFTLAKV